MSEVMCPLCGYTTMVWDDPEPVCPECDRSVKRRLDRRLRNSDVAWTADGPVMLPVEQAEDRLSIYRMLGVVEA